MTDRFADACQDPFASGGGGVAPPQRPLPSPLAIPVDEDLCADTQLPRLKVS
jgi:hypothetical protein